MYRSCLVMPVCMLLLTGCTGTMVTRGDRPMPHVTTAPHSLFGGYPFQAVVVDMQMEMQGVNDDGEHGRGSGNPVGPILSLAVDLVVDLVLSPIDLVAWPFGCHKRGWN